MKDLTIIMMFGPRELLGAPGIIVGAPSTLRAKIKIPPSIFKVFFVHPTHSA